jgi:ankyrin repeat protein
MRAEAWQAVEQMKSQWQQVLAQIPTRLPPPEKIPDRYDKNDLQQVCLLGDFPAVQAIINKGADIHLGTEHALIVTALSGYIDIVRLLLKHGADIHARNDRAVAQAAEKGQFAMVDFLLGQGALIDAIHPEDLEEYDRYKVDKQQDQLQLAEFAQKLAKPLTAVFNAVTWAGHSKEMVQLWQTVPEELQSGIDFPHLYAEAQIQFNRQKHKKVVLK